MYPNDWTNSICTLNTLIHHARDDFQRSFTALGSWRINDTVHNSSNANTKLQTIVAMNQTRITLINSKIVLLHHHKSITSTICLGKFQSEIMNFRPIRNHQTYLVAETDKPGQQQASIHMQQGGQVWHLEVIQWSDLFHNKKKHCYNFSHLHLPRSFQVWNNNTHRNIPGNTHSHPIQNQDYDVPALSCA